jgi:hypothetical protein
MQTVHSSDPWEAKTHPAPEPRDIVWSHIAHTPGSLLCRELLVLAAVGLLLFFWIFPITALASLLSYKEIKKVMPWLGRLIDNNDKIRAIVQNSLPSVAMITLNAILPFILEGKVGLSALATPRLISYRIDICSGLQSSQLGRVLDVAKVSAT